DQLCQSWIPCRSGDGAVKGEVVLPEPLLIAGAGALERAFSGVADALEVGCAATRRGTPNRVDLERLPDLVRLADRCPRGSSHSSSANPVRLDDADLPQSQHRLTDGGLADSEPLGEC